MKRLIAITIGISMAIGGSAQDIRGSWNGVLNAGSVNLPLVLHIDEKEGVYSATMDSPLQGAKGIPVSTITFEHAKLSFAIAKLGATYEGVMQSDSIAGTFKQNGMSFPLNLSRTKEGPALLARPQDPKPPYPYNAEEVQFENKEAGITLAGTLTYPREGKDFPVAILVTGSGAQNRNEELLGHKPFLVLSDYLTRNGIAVLRYDDRGVGESGGKYATANLDNFTSDAASAISYVKTRKEINPKKFGIIGHSEGGTIAFMLASEKKHNLGFIVSMAGMAIPGDSLLQMQRYLIAKASGVPDEMIALNETLMTSFSQMIDKHPADYIQQNMDQILDEVLPESLRGNATARTQCKGAIKQLMSPEIQSLLKYNPAEALKKIQCPVLALGGEKDLQVPADINLDRVKALVKGPVTIKKYPGLNHLFQHCTTGLINEYGSIEETIAPEVMKDISIWIKERVYNK